MILQFIFSSGVYADGPGAYLFHGVFWTAVCFPRDGSRVMFEQQQTEVMWQARETGRKSQKYSLAHFIAFSSLDDVDIYDELDSPRIIVERYIPPINFHELSFDKMYHLIHDRKTGNQDYNPSDIFSRVRLI